MARIIDLAEEIIALATRYDICVEFDYDSHAIIIKEVQNGSRRRIGDSDCHANCQKA